MAGRAGANGVGSGPFGPTSGGVQNITIDLMAADSLRRRPMKVKDVMTTNVLTVEEDTSFKDTVELVIEHRVSGVPVVDQDGHLVGLVTEADLVSKEAFDLRHRRPI